jgi:hypothetical protein
MNAELVHGGHRHPDHNPQDQFQNSMHGASLPLTEYRRYLLLRQLTQGPGT